MTDLEKMEKIRGKIIALNESDAKSLLMLTCTNIYRVNRAFTKRKTASTRRFSLNYRFPLMQS